jgi:hypothetical protein
MLLKEKLSDSKLTDHLKEYAAYQRQGGKDPFETYMIRQKQAGATAITVDNRAENAEAVKIGEGAGGRANATMDAARAASKTLYSLSRVNTILQDVQQGKVEPARQTISAWAKSFGLDDTAAERLGLDPKGVGSAQALTALVNEMVVGKIGSGGFPANNFSDADRRFLETTVPQLGNDPRANKIIVEVARRVALTDIQKAKEWSDWRQQPGNKKKSYDDFEISYATTAADRDLFGDLARDAQALVGTGRGAPGPQGAGAASSPPSNARAPGVGTVEQGFRFRGGDPSKPENWERAR